MGGMMMSSTSDFTMVVKAAPMMMPTAMSSTLPLRANSLNSLSTFRPPALLIPTRKGIVPRGSGRYNGKTSRPLLVPFEPGHELDESAGEVAVIEVMDEDLVPSVLAGAGRAGQREEIGTLRHARRRARLDGRGADLLEAHAVEKGREAVDLLVIDGLEGFRRHVPAGEAGAA